MPYVKQEARKRLDLKINQLANELWTGGELNYAITRLAVLFVKIHCESRREKINYIALAEKGYAHLQAATAEFYRRVLGPYEDRKRRENGDVYKELLK